MVNQEPEQLVNVGGVVFAANRPLTPAELQAARERVASSPHVNYSAIGWTERRVLLTVDQLQQEIEQLKAQMHRTDLAGLIELSAAPLTDGELEIVRKFAQHDQDTGKETNEPRLIATIEHLKNQNTQLVAQLRSDQREHGITDQLQANDQLKMLNQIASRLRTAAIWMAENPRGTPVPCWVDRAINDQRFPVDQELLDSQEDPDDDSLEA